MAELYCDNCIFENKSVKELPCRLCVNGKGVKPYFLSAKTVHLIAEQIIKKVFEEQETKND